MQWCIACNYPGCNINNGQVPKGQAVQCTICKRHFHKAHKQTPICNVCRNGPRPPVQGDYRMPQNDARDEFPEGFQEGQGSPNLASRMGTNKFLQWLRTHLDFDAVKEIHPLADEGVKDTTREAHYRAIKALLRAPHRCRNWPIVRTILEVLETERKFGNRGRGKKWVTTNTWVGHYAGMMERLPQYTKGKLNPIHLSQDPEWRDASTTIARLARQTANIGLPAITKEEMRAAIDAAAHIPMVKAAMIIAWHCMARVGDVLLLQTAHVRVSPSHTEPALLTAFFCEGKVISRGHVDPYHIHTYLPPDLAIWLQEYIAGRTTKQLFPLDTELQKAALIRAIREHLRVVHPRLEVRAVRRGALQQFAATPGVTLNMVLQFSKHTDVRMLKRYLKYGGAKNEEISGVAPHMTEMLL